MPSRAASPLLLALILAAATVSVAQTTSSKNPFLPPSVQGPANTSTHENIEFAGVSQIGKTTTLIFQDKAAKKNRWVGIGETVEGISVLNYDPRLEQVVVKINGAEKTLALRKASSPVNSGAGPGHTVVPPPPAASFNVAPPAPPPAAVTAQTLPAPAPTADQSPAKPASNTPEGQVKAETEARMLVSDLLEIGMAQRKAYEEAQRRAAEGKTRPADQPPPATQK